MQSAIMSSTANGENSSFRAASGDGESAQGLATESSLNEHTGRFKLAVVQNGVDDLKRALETRLARIKEGHAFNNSSQDCFAVVTIDMMSNVICIDN